MSKPTPPNLKERAEKKKVPEGFPEGTAVDEGGVPKLPATAQNLSRLQNPESFKQPEHRDESLKIKGSDSEAIERQKATAL